jgi:hypothetical protein
MAEALDLPGTYQSQNGKRRQWNMVTNARRETYQGLMDPSHVLMAVQGMCGTTTAPKATNLFAGLWLYSAHCSCSIGI